MIPRWPETERNACEKGDPEAGDAAALSIQPDAAHVRCSRSKPEGYSDKLLTAKIGPRRSIWHAGKTQFHS